MNHRLLASFVILLGLLVGTATAQPSYDLVIQNGRVLDGSGSPWVYADIGISGDRIAAVGDLSDAEATRIIDASGLYVAPGFIDVHSHAGSGLDSEELSHAEPLLAQGITTAFINPDGGGAVDLAEQRQALLEHGLGVNVAQMVPHGSIRREVIGTDDRAPTAEELDEMRALVREGMQNGAFGLSSGLFYSPGSFAETDELIELGKEVQPYGGAYSSHIRDEGDYNIGVVAAVDEVIDIARGAGIPGVVTHVKALGPRVWGYSEAIVKRIERARQEGVEVWADQYPYAASATGLSSALVPRWAQAGGGDAFRERLEDPETLERIKEDIAENLDRRGGAERLQFRSFSPDPSIEGTTLADVAQARGLDPVEATLELVQEGSAGVVSFNMHMDDVHNLMRQPWTMTSSDGGLVPMGQGVPHPRNYGSFPRKIRAFALESNAISLPTAIRSMTQLSASVFRMQGRGQLRPGAIADVVVFDLDRLQDRAEFQDPHQLSEGMVYVLVNGELAIDEGAFTGNRPGRVLDRQHQP